MPSSAAEGPPDQVRLPEEQSKPSNYSLDTHQTGVPRRLKKKTLPGKTFRLHDEATHQCNDHLARLTSLSEIRVPVDL